MELESVNLLAREKILSIFEKAPAYFLQVEGCLPSLGTVDDALLCEPARISSHYRKEFAVIRNQNEAIGTVELHIHHPEKGIVYIGLLLVREDLQKRGYGRECYRVVEQYLSDTYHAEIIRLGVSSDNDVSGFWSKMGFHSNGHSYNYMGERKVNHVVEYEKRIALGRVTKMEE